MESIVTDLGRSVFQDGGFPTKLKDYMTAFVSLFENYEYSQFDMLNLGIFINAVVKSGKYDQAKYFALNVHAFYVFRNKHVSEFARRTVGSSEVTPLDSAHVESVKQMITSQHHHPKISAQNLIRKIEADNVDGLLLSMLGTWLRSKFLNPCAEIDLILSMWTNLLCFPEPKKAIHALAAELIMVGELEEPDNPIPHYLGRKYKWDYAAVMANGYKMAKIKN
jgi:hypothetical protein